MSLLISDGTVIDGISSAPIEASSIWIEGKRIKAVGKRDALPLPPDIQVIDARGKFVIPGLMNANVHLLGDIRLENLARYSDRYEDLIIEAAQVALRNGLTTVFDTWGPRRFLMSARDRIGKGEVTGSRIFCAGNIIGFEGPLSEDFMAKAAEVASAAFVKRINAIWVENVGRHLMWLTPQQVRDEVRTYISRGIDFVKYASNEHGAQAAGAFLQFSPSVQAVIVEEAHRAGITAQAHCMSVEGLRLAIEAGCDLITHCNITGPTPIPETTLELFARRRTGAVIFPWTERGLEWIKQNVSDLEWTIWSASDTNARNLIRSGAPLLLANDGTVYARETQSDPSFSKGWDGAPGDDSLRSMATGHFAWFTAMEEKGCEPLEMLRAATLNIAVAYGKDQDLGTIEVGKFADLLILEKNPLLAAENFRSLHSVIKDGVLVDREALPNDPILTRPMAEPVEEERSFKPFTHTGSRFPLCPLCMSR